MGSIERHQPEESEGQPVILSYFDGKVRREVNAVLIPHAKPLMPDPPQNPSVQKNPSPSVRESQWESSHGQDENGDAQGNSTPALLPLNEEAEHGER